MVEACRGLGVGTTFGMGVARRATTTSSSGITAPLIQHGGDGSTLTAGEAVADLAGRSWQIRRGDRGRSGGEVSGGATVTVALEPGSSVGSEMGSLVGSIFLIFLFINRGGQANHLG